MNEQDNAEIIYAYTREQAIEDGVLVDVSETAKEAGFKFPVAMTTAVFNEYVVVPDGVTCQDERGRLWDILCMCRFEILRTRPESHTLHFDLNVRNDERAAKKTTLKSILGPDDQGNPCITIMRPDED